MNHAVVGVEAARKKGNVGSEKKMSARITKYDKEKNESSGTDGKKEAEERGKDRKVKTPIANEPTNEEIYYLGWW